MKKIIFLLLAQIAITAQGQNTKYSMLKLRLSDTSLISVRLDGIYIDRRTHSLTLDGIRPGVHLLEVYSSDEARKRRRRIYTGRVTLRGGNVNIGIVDVDRRSLGMRVRTMNAGDRSYAQGRPGGKKPQSEDIQDDIYQQAPDSRPEESVTEPTASRDEQRPAQSSEEGLAASTMDDLGVRIRTLLTDSEKESQLKKDLDGKRLSSAQLREILGWVAFESTRLSIAQWSYSYVVDKGRFPELEDVFEYAESKKEFRKIFGK